MARITVEDCLEVVDNRFELVMMAAKRARQLANGVEPQLDNSETNDKPTVLALREIAARQIDQRVHRRRRQVRARAQGARGAGMGRRRSGRRRRPVQGRRLIAAPSCTGKPRLAGRFFLGVHGPVAAWRTCIARCQPRRVALDRASTLPSPPIVAAPRLPTTRCPDYVRALETGLADYLPEAQRRPAAPRLGGRRRRARRPDAQVRRALHHPSGRGGRRSWPSSASTSRR